MLDSVRAARDWPDASGSDRFAVWGHSQGGHAALYTGELAARYAPGPQAVRRCRGRARDLSRRAVRRRPDDLLRLRSDGDDGAVLVAPRRHPGHECGRARRDARLEKTAHDCIKSLLQFEAIEKAAKPLQSEQFLKVDPSKVEPWKGIMERNSPGQAPAGAPVFIAQGTADTTVRPAITKRFGEALCAQGVRVSFVELPGVTHTFAARDSAAAAINWMTDRFRGATGTVRLRTVASPPLKR